MTIIGILGRARAGKDTVATAIKNVATTPTVILRLAQPIKDAVCALYNIEHDTLESNKKEEIIPGYTCTPRRAMQEITEYYMKRHGRDFFSKALFSKIDKQQFGCVIIPDIRYPHDIHEVHKRGGYVIKVQRPENPVNYACEDTVDDCEYDFSIVNDATKESLETHAINIYNIISNLTNQ